LGHEIRLASTTISQLSSSLPQLNFQQTEIHAVSEFGATSVHAEIKAMSCAAPPITPMDTEDETALLLGLYSGLQTALRFPPEIIESNLF
jgi:hypothetical protein